MDPGSMEKVMMTHAKENLSVRLPKEDDAGEITRLREVGMPEWTMDNQKTYQIIMSLGKNKKTHYLPRPWESAGEKLTRIFNKLGGGSPP